MRLYRRCTRIFILCLLGVSVFVPIFLLSFRLKNLNSEVSKGYVEDLSIIKHRTESQILSAIKQEEGEGLKEPPLIVYKDGDLTSAVSFSSTDDNRIGESGNVADKVNFLGNNVFNLDVKEDRQKPLQKDRLPISGEKQHSQLNEFQQDENVQYMARRALDEKVKEMKDQVVRAKAYLNFVPPNSSSHFVKELKLRIKEVERATDQITKSSYLSRSALQKMKAMNSTLLKASRIYPDCSAMVKKLRAMTYNAEEQVRSQKMQETFLAGLGGRTIPKGLHCLSLKLTAEYFSLEPEKRVLPNMDKLQDPELYHFAVFSDNVLACSVVVNSTISTAREPERIVFHVVTDSLNLPAISMWFLLNPPGKSTIQVESIDNFGWLSTRYNATLQKEGSVDPRYISALNHLRFYLPDVFPLLKKIVLLDHDVVAQRDLTGLWNINMTGKVNGAVETCNKVEPSFRRMDMFINFTDSMVAKKFDAQTCTWAFGMNVFDLQEWRRHNLTGIYHKYLHMGNKRPLWKAGSLPIGWITFYKHIVALDGRWHVLGLGYDSGVRQADIEQAAVIHFDGISKPWLDIGLAKYKHYWTKYVKYEHPYLQQCNIHE
ncbi:probable galacturonosyltransferase 6 isoform X1 [Olea europaea var. sylvestris]|uniref:probable galacturonosyltransferase 6 isoform X1 n=1 Tax=Olea europaea var. sylvestris TaxID=158386 RepID=UPI000C1D2908|nr:probable galacturonosyltransferase 6 isoform X1 [Olea europaea var. sylvestris]